MIRAIVDNPHASWPKFPRVIEAETEESLERKIGRCLKGLLGWQGEERFSKTTVIRVRGTEDVTAHYVAEGAAGDRT